MFPPPPLTCRILAVDRPSLLALFVALAPVVVSPNRTRMLVAFDAVNRSDVMIAAIRIFVPVLVAAHHHSRLRPGSARLGTLVTKKMLFCLNRNSLQLTCVQAPVTHRKVDVLLARGMMKLSSAFPTTISYSCRYRSRSYKKIYSLFFFELGLHFPYDAFVPEAAAGVVRPQHFRTKSFVGDFRVDRAAQHFSVLDAFAANHAAVAPWSGRPHDARLLAALFFRGRGARRVAGLRRHVGLTVQQAEVRTRPESRSTTDRTLKRAVRFEIQDQKAVLLTGDQSPVTHAGHDCSLHPRSTTFSCSLQCESPTTCPSLSTHLAVRLWRPPPQVREHNDQSL